MSATSCLCRKEAHTDNQPPAGDADQSWKARAPQRCQDRSAQPPLPRRQSTKHYQSTLNMYMSHRPRAHDAGAYADAEFPGVGLTSLQTIQTGMAVRNWWLPV